MALLDGGQALVEFCQVRITLNLCHLAVQIDAFLLGKIIGAVALDGIASRLVARESLNGHTHLLCCFSLSHRTCERSRVHCLDAHLPPSAFPTLFSLFFLFPLWFGFGQCCSCGTAP